MAVSPSAIMPAWQISNGALGRSLAQFFSPARRYGTTTLCQALAQLCHLPHAGFVAAGLSGPTSRSSGFGISPLSGSTIGPSLAPYSSLMRWQRMEARRQDLAPWYHPWRAPLDPLSSRVET